MLVTHARRRATAVLGIGSVVLALAACSSSGSEEDGVVELTLLTGTVEAIVQTSQALADAFKGKDTAAQISAIRSQGGVNADGVVHALARGLRSKDDGVRIEAISALGWHPSKEALKQLHRLYRRERKLLADDEAAFASPRAQHRSHPIR